MQENVYIDVESTGRDPRRHKVIDLAAVRVTEDGRVLAWMSEKIWPVDMSTAEPVALQINGFDEAVWQREGVSEERARRAFDVVSRERCTLVGHCVGFDLRFLRLTDRFHLDTMSMCDPLKAKERLRDRKLTTVAEHLGVNITAAAHSALGDVLRCWGIHTELCGRDRAYLAPLPEEKRVRA